MNGRFSARGRSGGGLPGGTTGARLASLASLLALVVVLGLYVRHVLRTFAAFTIDDAAISYAYAANLADGHGFRLTPNASPVEGFSNPLEVLLLVPCRWLGVDLDLAAKLLNVGAVALAALFVALLVWRDLSVRARFGVVLPCAFAFLWPTFNHWIAAGLEGGLLCALQMASLGLLLSWFRPRWRDQALAAVALLLVLVRPEGVVYGALAVLGRMFLPGRRWRTAGLFLVGCLAIGVLRFALFRDWLPNTFYAKVTGEGTGTWHAGVDYLWKFFTSYGLAYFACALPLFALLAPFTRVAALVAMAQLTFAVVFAVAAGGDWMRHFRFMQALQGPYWTLCLVGWLAALSLRPRRRDAWWAPLRANLVLLSLGPMVFFGLHGWRQRTQAVAADHDVDMRKIAAVGARYRHLGERLDLGRPLLIADVDVGGMAYPAGIDVLDLGGLADPTIGYAWFRRPTDIVDYVFGYRRPHTIHMHGGWVEARPMHLLSPFELDYRVMGAGMMDQLSVSWLTAIRADLVDPPAAPVLAAQDRLGAVLLLGASSLPQADGQHVLFIHAWQVENGDPRRLLIRTAAGRGVLGAWHSQHDVNRGPAGSALLGMVRLPVDALPIHIDGTEIALTVWPDLDLEVTTAEALSRLPLYRLAGLPAPACHPDEFLLAEAEAGARARGARLLADLCGGGLSWLARLGLAQALGSHRLAQAPPQGQGAQARVQDRLDDHADALRIGESLGLPTSTLQAGKIERANRARTPYDEVSGAWARRLLKAASPTPAQIRAGLSALVLAREYDKALLTALARGFTSVPEARGPLCRAMSALALQPYLVPSLDCPDADREAGARAARVLRQGFEDPTDIRLSLDRAGRSRIYSHPPLARLGGQGRGLLMLGPCTIARCPEVVWGPLPWSGRQFGALAAGSRSGTSIVVEGRSGGRWIELGRTEGPPNEAILSPVLCELRPTFATEVRVRVSNRARNLPLTVDALTFLDLDLDRDLDRD